MRTRLEQVGAARADATPQAAPFADRRGNDLLGLARDGGEAMPMTRLDGSR